MFQVPLAGQAINTATIGIETTITSGNISCTNISGTNATFNQLSTTTFNPANLNTSTINTQNLNVVNTIPLLNVSVLNASQKNVSNMSVENLSVTNFTADNISTGSLIAGTNINISNNVISAENEALLPANANFSSVNSCSLSVTGTTILGGTSYVSDSLIVTNAVNTSTITANNLSTGDMQFTSPLFYDSTTKILSCAVQNSANSGNLLPVTSNALYQALANFSEQPSLIHTQLYRKGLSNYNISIDNLTLSAGSSGNLFYIDYTPKFEDSLIKVTTHFSYEVGGHGADSTEFKLSTQSGTHQLMHQVWSGNAGGGTRSSTGSTLSAVYLNQDHPTPHRIQIYYDNSTDDTFTLSDSADFICAEVTEVLQTASTYNNNLRIGSGNISCGNIDSNNISCNILSPISMNIQVSDSNIGGLTMGFSPTSIASESSITMASGGAFTKSVTMENLSDDFNISSRSSGKTFRFSGGQVPLLEITDTNTSCQDLIVNGDLDVTGNISFTNSNHGNINASNIISETLLVNSTTTFADDVDINGDVEIGDLYTLSSFNNSFDNLSANNASIVNLSVTGSITGSGLETASLTAGSNISILNGSISAYIEGGTDWNVSSIHVDNDVGIAGNLNVSETSTFQQSLNVQNQLFVGEAGNVNGQMVLYSDLIGNNLVISNNGDDTCSITGQGLTDEINISLGGNEIIEFLNDRVNINGFLNVSNISINNSVDVDELTTSEINISDTNSTGQYTRIHRQGNQTFFVGNNSTLGCDYKFYTGTDSQSLALEINRSLTTTINRLEVVNTMESVNICTDNNISCGGSLTIADDLSVTGALILNNLNVSQINNSTLNSITINNSTIDSDSASISSLNVSIVNVSNNVNVCGNVNTCGEANVSGNLNVSGYSYFQQAISVEDDIFIFGDQVALGHPEGGANTELYLHSSTVGDSLRMAHVSESEFIFQLTDANESMNFLISNVSVLVLDNSQATFNTSVNISDTLNVSTINTSTINLTTFNSTTINSSTLNSDLINASVINNSTLTNKTINTSTIHTSVVSVDDGFISNILVNSIAFGHDLFFNSGSVAIHQFNSGSTHVNCGTGQDVRIKSNGTRIASFTTTNISFDYPLICSNISTTNFSATDATFTEIDFPVQDPYLYFNPLDNKLNVSTKAIEDDIFGGTINVSIINVCRVDVHNICFEAPAFSSGTIDWRGLGNKIETSTFNGSTMNASFLDVINGSVSNDLDVDGILDCFDLVADTGTITTFDSTTANISTLNASTINGENLSTASILFSTDFQFALNTLSLAPSETAAAIQSATLSALNTSVNSLQGNFSTINSDFGTIGGVLNSNTINLSTLNYSSADGINFSATNISATSITAPDVQPLLTAGTNITIVGNTISATGGSSFDPTNISNTNLSSTNITTTNLSATNLSVAGNITCGNASLTTQTNGAVSLKTIHHTNWITQSSTGFTTINGNAIWLNSDVGVTPLKLAANGLSNFEEGDVNITNALNVSTINASLINNHRNYMRYYNQGPVSLTSSQTFVDVTFSGTSTNGQKENTSLVQGSSSNSIFTIQKAGYYRFFCQVGVFNNSYGDRVVWRMRPVFNGAQNNTYSQLFCYTRDNNFGNRGTINGELIRSMSVNDTVRFRIDVGKATFNSNFGSTMDGLQIAGGPYLEIQYLGET